MSRLLDRVEKLEAAITPSHELLRACVRLVAADGSMKELRRLRHGSRIYERLEDEGEDDFIHRAGDEAFKHIHPTACAVVLFEASD